MSYFLPQKCFFGAFLVHIRLYNAGKCKKRSGKLGEYAKAISTIVNYGSYKSKKYEKSIKDALKVLY